LSLPLTPERLRAVYECLRAFPPFSSLPPGDQVKFRVTRHKDRHGDYYVDGVHHIRVSARFIGTMDSLTRVMAHEMVHLKTGLPHGAAFKRMARSVCKRFGWDVLTF
jgi:hypothetical protein